MEAWGEVVAAGRRWWERPQADGDGRIGAWAEGSGWVGGSEGGLWERCDRGVVCPAGKAGVEWWRVAAGGHHEVSRRGASGPGQGHRNWMEVRMPMPQLGHRLGLRAVSEA